MSAPVTETAAPPTGNPLAVDEGVKPTIPLLLGIFVAHVVIWIGLILLLVAVGAPVAAAVLTIRPPA